MRRPALHPGLRIRVADVLGMLAEGVSHDDILRDFPYLDRGHAGDPRWPQAVGLRGHPERPQVYTANGLSNDVSVIDLQHRLGHRHHQSRAGPWDVVIGR